MKTNLLSIAVLSLLGFVPMSTYAQNAVKSKITNPNGSISLITFNENSALSATSSKELFKNYLNISDNVTLELKNSTLDHNSTFRDERYQQFYKGILVEYGMYNLHYNAGKLVSMNGELFNTENVPTTPSISSEAAFKAAVASVGAERYMWQDVESAKIANYEKPKGDLVILPIERGENSYSVHLAYRFDIFAEAPISRAYVYVDAVKGNVIHSNAIMKHSAKEDFHYKETQNRFFATNYPTIHFPNSPLLATGNAATRYSGTKEIETSLNAAGTNYILYDQTRGNGVRTYNLKKGSVIGSAVDFTDADNDWTAAEHDNANFDNAALDAHWGVEKTYDYFKNEHNRNSYDNNGTLLRSYVHYGSNYDNAGWNGSYMIYGDGGTLFKPLTAFDVTAHELGHGVCSSSSSLAYNRESGALNEGYSDIWGAAAEYKYSPEKNRWLIGEEIAKTAPFYLRSMVDPKTANQPDTYRGQKWYPATVEEGCVTPSSTVNDNCGVHYNSGVLNHWFYILTEGKTGTNDHGKSYSVTGIGIDKAAKIAYRTETAFLTSSSNYMAARNFSIQVAIELYGEHSPEAIATQDAFYAVGVGPKYSATPDTEAPTTPLNLAAKNITGSSTTLDWGASTDNVDLESYILYRNNTQIATIAPNKLTHIDKGLAPNTSYQYQISAKDYANNESEKSNIAYVTTLNVPNYCVPTGYSTADERIRRVQFNTIDNSSTSSDSYEDFSYISTDVTKGTPYTITITPQWTGNTYAEGYSVFVDLNNDGNFSADERLFNRTATTATPITGTVTIPTTANNGRLRMRVIMTYNTSVTTGCATSQYGQIEDYSLFVSTLGVQNATRNTEAIYPNPVKDVATIVTKNMGEIDYSITNSAGQVVKKGTSIDKKVAMKDLVKGSYVITLKYKDGTTSTQKLIKE